MAHVVGRREGAGGASPRRQQLLAIATQVFAEKGYRGTTVRDIAERADILSGSLFYHFATKDSIVEELLRPVFAELVAHTDHVVAAELSPDEKVRLLVSTYMEDLGRNLLVMRLLQSDWRHFVTLFPFLGEGMARINKAWIAVLRQGMHDGVLRHDVEVHVLLQLIRGALTQVIRWYDPDGPVGIADIKDAAIRVLLDGIRAEGTRA